VAAHQPRPHYRHWWMGCFSSFSPLTPNGQPTTPQQVAEFATVLRFCQENGLSLVHGECVRTFVEPTARYHRAPRWVRKLLGKPPKEGPPSHDHNSWRLEAGPTTIPLLP
jgi:hypothetical protein